MLSIEWQIQTAEMCSWKIDQCSSNAFPVVHPVLQTTDCKRKINIKKTVKSINKDG